MVLIISVAASLIWIRILKSFDDVRGFKSKRTAVSGFFLYGLLSAPLVMLLYNVAGPLLYPLTRESAVFKQLFLVGPVEELGKFLVFYIAAVGSNSIQEPRDGVLHAASVGLAFAVIENVFYAVYGIDILLYRSIMAAAGHMSYAAIWGYAAGVYLYTRPSSGSHARSPERGNEPAYGAWIVVSALAVAAFCHALYNSFLEFNLLGAALILDAGVLSIALASLSYLKKVSPFAEMPFSEYRAAIPQLQEALRRNPHNFVLNKRIGLHYIRGRNNEKGRQHLKHASQAKPEELSTRFYLALLEFLKAAEWRRRVEWRREEGGAIVSLNGPAGAAYEKAREAVFRIAMQMTLHSLRQLRRQVKQVFRIYPQRQVLFDLCNEIIAEKRGKTDSGSKAVPPLARKQNRNGTTYSARGIWMDRRGQKEPSKAVFPEPPLAKRDPVLAARKSRALGRIIDSKRRDFE